MSHFIMSYPRTQLENKNTTAVNCSQKKMTEPQAVEKQIPQGEKPEYIPPIVTVYDESELLKTVNP